MGDTEISWTHRLGTRGRTWNVAQGCSLLSEGCRNCYAMRLAARFAESGWSKGLINLKTRRWNGEVRMAAHKLADPLRWREPSTVFVNSMSDLFHEGFTNEQIAAVFGVMAACPQHTFQVLTKRAKRMREWFDWVAQLEHDPWTECHAAALAADIDDTIHTRSGGDAERTWPLRNVWLGTSTENQDAADERIPELLATPAALRFLSVEPMIGPVDLTSAFADATCELWVIAGAESGPGARPADPAWFHEIAAQCRPAGVPFFLKQMVVDGKLRKEPSEFPDGLRIQEFPR